MTPPTDNVDRRVGWNECGHTHAAEMAAFDALLPGVRRAIREAHIEWCAVDLAAMRLTCYSQAKRRLACQERAYLAGAA